MMYCRLQLQCTVNAVTGQRGDAYMGTHDSELIPSLIAPSTHQNVLLFSSIRTYVPDEHFHLENQPSFLHLFRKKSRMWLKITVMWDEVSVSSTRTEKKLKHLSCWHLY